MSPFLACVLSVILSAVAAASPLDVTWENLDRFANTNAREVKLPVRGLVVNHPWCGQTAMYDPAKNGRDFAAEPKRRFAEMGVVYLHVYEGPWSWMNEEAVRLADEVVDAVILHFGLPSDVPVRSAGMSMGGAAAIMWARFSRHRVVSVVANCPPTDLVAHVGERFDLPVIFRSAYGDKPDPLSAIRSRSPMDNVSALPDADFFIVHSDADPLVSKTLHADRFAAALKRAGRRVTYVVSEDTGHCDLSPVAKVSYERALYAPLDGRELAVGGVGSASRE